MRSAVVLPQPDGPTSTISSPSGISSVRLLHGDGAVRVDLPDVLEPHLRHIVLSELSASAAGTYTTVCQASRLRGMPYDLCIAGRVTSTRSAGESSPALFGQVAREPRLSDKVADMMLETILSKRLEVGDKLPSERELGEQFGVSRTVVREAVRALVAKGVIEVRSGSGLRVAAVDAAAVSESIEALPPG